LALLKCAASWRPVRLAAASSDGFLALDDLPSGNDNSLRLLGFGMRRGLRLLVKTT